MARKILVIDDDADFVEAVKTLLEANGFEVVSAENGEEGFEKARQELPGLILLDVMMSDKTEGFVYSRIFDDDERLKGIPVVLVTGIRQDMNISYKFEPDEVWLPVKEVIEKPVRPEQLLELAVKYIK